MKLKESIFESLIRTSSCNRDKVIQIGQVIAGYVTQGEKSTYTYSISICHASMAVFPSLFEFGEHERLFAGVLILKITIHTS